MALKKCPGFDFSHLIILVFCVQFIFVNWFNFRFQAKTSSSRPVERSFISLILFEFLCTHLAHLSQVCFSSKFQFLVSVFSQIKKFTDVHCEQDFIFEILHLLFFSASIGGQEVSGRQHSTRQLVAPRSCQVDQLQLGVRFRRRRVSQHHHHVQH